jgi:hypothetical protein
MIKIGSENTSLIKAIQAVIEVPADGIFGKRTLKALVNWQRQHSLVADGVAGPKTLHEMGILDTDLKNQSVFRTEEGLVIERNYLPKGEYIEESFAIGNDYAFLHHTAGNCNPHRTIKHWGRDSRGRVATEFVLGGQDHKTGNADHDGEMVQCFPSGCQGWHIGRSGSYYMNRHSVGLEICSMGYLTEDLKSYVGSQARQSQVATLKEPFKGHKYYHRYSDKQIEATRKWLLYISARDNINLDVGLIDWIKREGASQAFGFHQDAYEGKVKGLLTHTNVRKDKSDCFPQDEFVDMLLSI